MVCGFGDAVSYETLAAKLAGARIDKSSRFTDWAHRPLTDRQLQYALSDVTHLRPAYEHLARRLAKTGRTDWVAEEMAVLTNPDTYRLEPREAWRRIKFRNDKPRAARHPARGRRLARGRSPAPRPAARSRAARRDALRDRRPCAERCRAISPAAAGSSRSIAENRQGGQILAAVKRGLELPASECPEPTAAPRPAGGPRPA